MSAENIESSLSYAALILTDAEVEVTSEKLQALVKAANIHIDSIWADIFAKALEGKNLKELLFNISAGPAVASAGGASSGGAAAAAEEAEEEKAESEAEESDDDMGFGLFD